MNKNLLFLAVVLLWASCSSVEVAPPSPEGPVPTERQLAWHQMELNAFIHFTTNTFTDLEWGYGDEDPDVFNPTEFDAEQWMEVLVNTGFKGVILTCKHHDGFSLWPSSFTEHSVKNSSWRDGNGNVVQEVHDACRKFDLEFGIYVSPWDRNRADYGQPSYVDYYRNQIIELFEEYGPVFEMWFDGAMGGDGYYGGARERRRIDARTYYEWPTTLSMIKEIDPDVLFFSDAGPDIRWCGNEEGYVNETNWNTISIDTLYPGKAGIYDLLNTGSEDGEYWVPAEVNVSIRPGWFYHSYEDGKVKTPEQLFEIYMASVGRGSPLLLNIPPDQRGLFHENDVKALKEWRKLLDEAFSNNLALNAKAKASTTRGNSRNFAATNVTDGNPETYWSTDDEVTEGNIVIDLKKDRIVKYVLLQEYIRLGQRVRDFSVDVWVDNQWVNAGSGTTIGYKRILQIDPVKTSRIRININDAKACPVISNVEVY